MLEGANIQNTYQLKTISQNKLKHGVMSEKYHELKEKHFIFTDHNNYKVLLKNFIPNQGIYNTSTRQPSILKEMKEIKLNTSRKTPQPLRLFSNSLQNRENGFKSDIGQNLPKLTEGDIKADIFESLLKKPQIKRHILPDKLSLRREFNDKSFATSTRSTFKANN